MIDRIWNHPRGRRRLMIGQIFGIGDRQYGRDMQRGGERRAAPEHDVPRPGRARAAV
jgi:hypothetical protein